MLEIEVDQAEDGALLAFDRILPIARAHRLTVYDALYLELAGRRGLPLATLDRELAAAARSVGIEILGENA
jgi:predicted nucleic acid-binding protein